MTDPYEFAVEAGHIMMFRRALGDDNPRWNRSDFATSAATDPPIAPPTFLQAAVQFQPDSHLRPKPGEPWRGSGREPTGTPGQKNSGLLHAEQHYTFHRPVRAGDVLVVSERAGDTWEREGKRGGKLVFRERITSYHTRTGELVATARRVTVETSRPVDQPQDKS